VREGHSVGAHPGVWEYDAARIKAGEKSTGKRVAPRRPTRPARGRTRCHGHDGENRGRRSPGNHGHQRGRVLGATACVRLRLPGMDGRI
jgi:hypothetical protein